MDPNRKDQDQGSPEGTQPSGLDRRLFLKEMLATGR